MHSEGSGVAFEPMLDGHLGLGINAGDYSFTRTLQCPNMPAARTIRTWSKISKMNAADFARLVVVR